ncbi:MAG: protein tyrosine phosphatase family protein [Burkholderiales bacterium]|nr:protein tyrosine phosphatase family protein [Burkholderiales bacterium]
MPVHADDSKIDAPNVVPISAHLVTSGQPTAGALAKLKEQGFDAVIYLAPTTVSDAVADEKNIVEKQGLIWVNIPIQFQQPRAADFEQFVATVKSMEGKKILVHCQVNMRASSMVFLYRTIVNQESPEKAYESVIKVWSPSGVWKELIAAQLAQHQIRFQPY